MQSGNHAPSFASDLPCPRSDIYSYSESYSYSYSDGVRWHLPAVHLARKSRESVPGVLSRRPPGTETPQKRSRCHFSPSTWHGFPTKACQVSFPCRPPGTESPRKRSRWHLPASTWHGIPAKAFQVSFPAVHLVRNLRESVPGGISLLPPGTEFLQKRSRCLFPPSTCHGIPAKAFQVASPCRPPGTEFLQKRSRWHLPAVHLARNSRESVPGSTSCRPPATVSLRKCSRWHLPASHLPRFSCERVPGSTSCRRHGIPAKAFQVASPCLPPGTVFPQKRVRCPFPAVHLARNPRESVSGVSSRLPPGTETLRKRGRCHFSPSTWHGIPAKVCQVSFPAFHLARKPRKSVPGVFSRLPPATAVHLIMGCCGFSVGHMAVFSMKRATISTPAAAEYMHLSENNDVPKKVQLQVSHVWTHLQYQNRLAGACRAHLSLRVCRVMLHLEMTTLCDDLTIKDFAIYVFCRCASALINTDA